MTLRAGARRVLPVILSAAFIGYFTLLPAGEGPRELRPGGYLLTDIILNVILFVPLGISLGLAGTRPRMAAAIAVLASGAIELAQLWWIPGRFSALHDVATNSAGAWLGALIVAHWPRREPIWRVAGPAAAALIVTAWVGGALLLAPSLPPPGGSNAQWAHDIGHHGVYTGRVIAMSVQGIPLADGWIQDTNAFQDALAAADTIRLEAVLVTGPPSAAVTQLASVVSSRQYEVIGVWQDGAAVVARHRLRLTDAGLRTPWIRLDGALPAVAGDTVRVGYEVDRRAMRLTATGPGQTVRAVMRLTPALFWSAFLPFDWQGGTGSRWWPLLPALFSLVVLGMALGGHPGLLILATAAAAFGGPLLGAGAFPDLASMVIAGVGPAIGWVVGRKVGLLTQNGPPP